MSKILSNAVSLRNAVVADAVLSEAAPRVPVPDAVGLPQGQPRLCIQQQQQQQRCHDTTPAGEFFKI